MKKNISVFIALLFFVTPVFASAQYNTRAVSPAEQKTAVTELIKQQKQETKNIQLRVRDTAASLKDRLFKRGIMSEKKGEEATSEIQTPSLNRGEKTTTIDESRERSSELKNETQEERQAPENARLEKEKRKEEISQKKIERQKQIFEKRKERIQAYFTRMFIRLEAAVERLNKLMTRIESRIQKFEERDIDVTDAREKLQKARDAIVEADFKLNVARGLVRDIIDGENPKEVFKNAREAVKSTVESIKKAHRALVDSIIALKGTDSPETAVDE